MCVYGMCVSGYICIYLSRTFVFYDLGGKITPWIFFNSSLNSCFSLKGKLRDGFIYKIIQIIGHIYCGS